ncbi:hypothetical protein BH11VER1_BH11VER1_01210 [soil metagenome]
MKTKFTMLVTILMLAVGAFFFATPAYTGLLSLPTTINYSERFCGSFVFPAILRIRTSL